MTRLTYAGGLDTLSLPDPENPAGPPLFEEIMHPGATHDVPDHPITAAWRARGLLVEPDQTESPPVPDISQVSREASKVRQRRAEAPAAATVGDPPGEPQE